MSLTSLIFPSQHLLNLVDKPTSGDITEEEIGQRILTSLKKNIGPSWILYNLAGLYWRIMGNHYHGIECYRRALVFAPDAWRDVPAVNLANLLYKAGMVNDAIVVMEEALAICDYEVSYRDEISPGIPGIPDILRPNKCNIIAYSVWYLCQLCVEL